MIAMGYVFIDAVATGEPRRIIKAYDSNFSDVTF